MQSILLGHNFLKCVSALSIDLLTKTSYHGSTEHSKGNKTVPEKVATTRTDDGQK